MLNILFQDSHLLALNKPENLLCVPGLCSPDNLYDRARREFPNIRVIHRLDMATSGIVLFAMNHAAQKAVGRQFEARQIQKRYRAIVQGHVISGNGEISCPMICDWPNRPKQKICWQTGRSAHTFYQVVRRFRGNSELTLHPITGRSHQLRVHCLHLGHPIVGDQLYNPRTSPHGRMMLHAEYMSLAHPHTGQLLTLHCDPQFNRNPTDSDG